nr:hypothetical protein [Pseudarthrobacter sp. NCCP-2145]
MFAVASMFGFESTAIYSDEAKDPRRTVARATYISVSVIAIFFAFITWMLVSYYGPTAVQGAAGAAVESGDATSFFFTAAVDKLGAWAGPVGVPSSSPRSWRALSPSTTPSTATSTPWPNAAPSQPAWPGPTPTAHPTPPRTFRPRWPW